MIGVAWTQETCNKQAERVAAALTSRLLQQASTVTQLYKSVATSLGRLHQLLCNQLAVLQRSDKLRSKWQLSGHADDTNKLLADGDKPCEGLVAVFWVEKNAAVVP